RPRPAPRPRRRGLVDAGAEARREGVARGERGTRMRWPPTAAAAVAAVGVLVAAPAPSHESTVRPCATAQLKIRLVKSFVAAGNVGGAIGFRNRSSASCRLHGWPRLVVLGRGE